MKIHLKFDFNTIATLHLERLLAENKVTYKSENFNEIELLSSVSHSDYQLFKELLQSNGIEIIENQKVILVQKIKSIILQMIQNQDEVHLKTSVYLSEQMNQSYPSISNLFSEVTYTSIENFIIMQKIEIVKQQIISNQYTLTEIAFKYNYSSVAHLSNQFKKCTGITPSAFERIIRKRAALTN